MRFSVILAVAMVAVFVVIFIRATFGEYAPVVFGCGGFLALHLFFKHIVNAN